MVVGDENSVQEYVIFSFGVDVIYYFLVGYYVKGMNMVISGQVRVIVGIELVYKQGSMFQYYFLYLIFLIVVQEVYFLMIL